MLGYWTLGLCLTTSLSENYSLFIFFASFSYNTGNNICGGIRLWGWCVDNYLCLKAFLKCFLGDCEIEIAGADIPIKI